MARYFLIPMYVPASGKGTREDPRSPKYLRELGLAYSIRDAGDFCLAEVSGDEKALAELSAQPDVDELSETDETIPSAKLARVEGRNLPLARKGTGREVIASLKQAILDKQVAESPQRVDDAIKRAIRG